MHVIIAVLIIVAAAISFLILIYALCDIVRLEFLFDHDKEAYWKEINNRELEQKKDHGKNTS